MRVLILAAIVVAATVSTVTVAVKQTSIRKNQQFYSPTLAVAKYGDKLKVLSKKGDWLKVSFKGKKGYVHSSAISGGGNGDEEKSSFMSGFSKMIGGDDKKPTQDEVALAGKGFNEKVEKKYRKTKKGVNYAAVDQMEKITVSEKKIARFVSKGKLKPREMR